MVAVGAVLAISLNSARGTLGHDEMISAVAATAHEDDMQRVRAGAPPAGEWVAATEWHRMMEPEDTPAFGAVAQGLAQTDFHPPLYFWILHLGLAAGLSPFSAGPILNVALGGVTAVATYLLARRIVGSLDALLAVLLWAVSAPVAVAVAELRQYALLMTLTTLFALAMAALLDRRVPSRSGWLLVALGAVTAAGTLSHHTFVGTAAGGAVLAVLASRWTGARRAGAAVAAIVAGWLLAVALFPHAVEQRNRLGTSASLQGARTRLFMWWDGLTDLVTPRRDFEDALGWIVAVLVVLLVVVVVIRRRELIGAMRRHPPLASVLFLGAWMVALSALTYALGLAPTYARGLRYVAPFVPLLAVGLVGVLRFCLPGWRAFVGLLAVASLAGALVFVAERRDDFSLQRATVAELGQANTVVVACVRRGFLPAFAAHLPSNAVVYADTPKRTAHQIDTTWVARLPTGSSPALLVASDSCGPGTLAAIDAALARHGVTRSDRVGAVERLSVYELTGGIHQASG